jgi:hypothetical protein
MESRLHVDILPQPDDFTCGPTCLHAVYRYYEDELPLPQVIAEVPKVEGGGTLGVHLGRHALARGYRATIYTYNLQMFDPTWFEKPGVDLQAKLREQRKHHKSTKFRHASDAYLDYLSRGGVVLMEDVSTDLIRGFLDEGVPILTGLSATYLHRSAREYGPNDDHDDVRGEPAGHFVVLCGYDHATRHVLVADPLERNLVSGTTCYEISADRVIAAILLGIVTYDGNLVIIRPPGSPGETHANAHRG